MATMKKVKVDTKAKERKESPKVEKKEPPMMRKMEQKMGMYSKGGKVGKPAGKKRS